MSGWIAVPLLVRVKNDIRRKMLGIFCVDLKNLNLLEKKRYSAK